MGRKEGGGEGEGSGGGAAAAAHPVHDGPHKGAVIVKERALQHTIRFSHVAGKDLQCDCLGQRDYNGSGAEQHFTCWETQ